MSFWYRKHISAIIRQLYIVAREYSSYFPVYLWSVTHPRRSTNIHAKRRDDTRGYTRLLPGATTFCHYVILFPSCSTGKRLFYYTPREAINVVTTYPVATIYISAYSDAITHIANRYSPTHIFTHILDPRYEYRWRQYLPAQYDVFLMHSECACNSRREIYDRDYGDPTIR